MENSLSQVYQKIQFNENLALIINKALLLESQTNQVAFPTVLLRQASD